MQSHKKKLMPLLFSLLILGCATEQPLKPLDSKLISEKILTKDPMSPAFKTYLIRQGYTNETLPFVEWGINELTLCALFYHTQLDIAKKQLTLANLAIQTAGLKSSPSVNASLAHSDRKNGDIRPWAYGLSVDIPIETNNKRGINIEKAQKLAEAAQLDVAETAWQLRNQIAIDLIAYHQNIAETVLLQQEVTVQADIAAMLEKRVDVGIASKTELSKVKLLALKTEHLLNMKRAQLSPIKAKLAADVGLSTEMFESIRIKPLSIENVLAQQAKILDQSLESKALQEQALLNRIDIRRSMAKYAVAESQIKLEVAKQTPDITLSPGIIFEFGDKIWSLGFSSLLNMLHKNTALIEEAKQLRAIEGAQFENLQAQTIAQISQAHARYSAAKQAAKQAEIKLTEQLAQTQKIQKQFDAGLIGKLDLKRHTLNTSIEKQQLVASQFELLQITNQIEDIMQKPLYNAFKMPELNNDQ